MGEHEVDMKDYMTDDKGRLVPVSMISEIDKTRDSLVKHVVEKAEALQAGMIKFKENMMANIRSFVELSAMEYDMNIGGIKGNIRLISFDGRYKVQVQVADRIDCDERVLGAKQLLYECADELSAGSRDEIKIVINDVFMVDSSGKISIHKLLTLRRYNIQHPKWIKAMQMIADSVIIVGTAKYIRCYKRDNEAVWQAISLDMAKL